MNHELEQLFEKWQLNKPRSFEHVVRVYINLVQEILTKKVSNVFRYM
jgi:acyl-CoA-binding protein